MKLTILFLFISLSLQAQISYRQSATSEGITLCVPIGNVTKGSIFLILSKERDRSLAYVNYVESYTKGLVSFYYGAGIHVGNRQTLNFKQDANSIFLAGATAIGGVKLSKNAVFISADLTPRVDFPFFGGCEMHKHCGEHHLGLVNFSIGLNL